MQDLNPLAIELNEHLQDSAPVVSALLSKLGKRIYLPKGILSQTAEATGAESWRCSFSSIAKGFKSCIFSLNCEQ